MHHLLYLPGLNDQLSLHKKLASLLPLLWRPHGVTIHVVPMFWENGEHFLIKQTRILTMVDSLLKDKQLVSIMGQSAGGSAAGTIFFARKNRIQRYINITGRLRSGIQVSPSLADVARNSVAFSESVIQFEKVEPKFTTSDRKRMMTIRPFWDEVVPAATVAILGATNIVAPFPEHVVGGICIDIYYVSRIANFLHSSAKPVE